MIFTIRQPSYIIGLFATLSLGNRATDNVANVEDHACCATLSAIPGLQIHYPSDPSYVNRTESYWSVSAQLNPECIVQPPSTSHVASIVKVLALQDGTCKTTNLAIRGGGHTTWAGSNNIDKGITIDLGLMNSTTFNPETNIVSIGPGARWNSVYAVLDPLGFTVAGGRAGSVGVAGFLTGGGNSFYTAEQGFACDNVINFEIVTANGDVINANSQENSDLFLVLKGGSGANFGIITRFDMQAFSAVDLWGGTMSYPKSVSQQHIKAYHAWTNGIQNYPEGSSIIFWSYLPDAKDIVILAAYEDTAGNVAPKGFEEFLAIPNSTSTMRLASHKALTDELEQPAGYRDCWFTMTFKNEITIYQKIIELHEAFVNEWKAFTTDPDFITQCMFQSIPTVFSQHSIAKGGNVLGLDKEPDNAVMLLLNIAVKSVEDEKVARQKLKEYSLKIRDFAQSVDGLVEWTYLNYADEWQDPLNSYGAENVAKIRAASKKFDPQGFFQTRVPGGFKISRVKEKSVEKEL